MSRVVDSADGAPNVDQDIVDCVDNEGFEYSQPNAWKNKINIYCGACVNI